MAKTDLMAELAEVVRVSEAATPGPFVVDAYGDVTANSEDIARIVTNDHDALLLAKSVNFLRTHHAELEAAVMDARGEREESWEVWQDDMCVAGSDSLADAQHYMLMYGQDGPVKMVHVITHRTDVIETVAAEQLADMHNSAREGL